MFLQPGPAPMLILQLLLYWIGDRENFVLYRIPALVAGIASVPLAALLACARPAEAACRVRLATGLVLRNWFGRRRLGRASTGAIVAMLAAWRFASMPSCLCTARPGCASAAFTRTKTRVLLTTVMATGAFIAIGLAIAACSSGKRMSSCHS